MRILDSLRARLLAPGRDDAGSIYGTLIAAATIAGAAENAQAVADIVITVLVTLVVYWVAHAYAAVLGHPARGEPHRALWAAAQHELLAEVGMLTACIIPIAGLLVASALGASLAVATSSALWLAVGILFGSGLIAARRGGHGVASAALSGVIFGLLGVGIVIAKTLLAH